MLGPTRRRAVAVVMAALALLAGSCGDDDETGDRSAGGALSGTVTVLAASSLTGAFMEIGDAFEDAHDGVKVRLSFDGSSSLATQILEGAPADVFASADEPTMAKVTDAGRAERPVVFATNELVIVVPAGNPDGVTGLADLGRSGRRVALCAPEVPCGRYADEAFARAGLQRPSASEETNVKGVVTKVALGEADAGLAYVTDVAADGVVEGVALAADAPLRAVYPAVVLDDAPNSSVAAAFVAFLTGDVAQAILRKAGFGAP